MKPTRILTRLCRITCRRLLRLKALVQDAASGVCHQDRTVAFVTIELQSAWSNFIRAYYRSCWRRPRTGSGHRIAMVVPGGAAHELGFAVTRWRPRATPTATGEWHRRDEPSWHNPAILITLARELSFTNRADIATAFSSGSRVFLDLPVYRNFFAHRGHGTFRAAMQNAVERYGIAHAATPSMALLSRPPGLAQSLLADWIDDMFLTAQFLC
jgi:hypothetical protein